ncbi:dipeptidase [Aquibacillus sp. 3ASR75-11]|uniref:Dipeptidase n=1 Tax=Terrihalobacillus insolitus TaxID=2950438 RepID=A0A9X3WYP4_9BACI|nr:dipeptidase [Terrihalobacillus insolitus]MDC3414343.1 dipeptidase [Terrihalobacillus insolitus]MDC3425819.1 dipeptidase [Terrihalobacillus insolitus]
MIIDAHCDALLKLWEKKGSFQSSDLLQVTNEKWKISPVKIQCFAIFVPDDVPEDSQFQTALEMVDIFYKQIVEPNSDIKVILSKEDLLSLKDNERGAMLTLEGCHSIGHDINKLKTLVRLGVRAVGLTWNQANAVSDGVGEKRGAGLSSFGEEVVDLLNEQQIWTDVSHLSYKGFFDVMERAKYPIASHSNAFAITPHRRNLDDRQIKALIERDGWIGITFVPMFLTEENTATVEDVKRHLHYFLELGAKGCLGFGSDFDGTSRFVERLYDHTDYGTFIQELKQEVSEETLLQLCYQNFIEKFPRTK